jgi:hypothetical protein
MVFTAAQTENFFTQDTQTGLDTRNCVQLQTKGIVNIEDLAKFTDEETWKQVIDNCRRPPKVPDVNGNLVEQEAFHLGAKSLHCLQVAAKCLAYYMATGRTITAANMQWNTVLTNFEVEWKALMKLKDDDTELPVMSKTVGIVK